MVKNTHKGICVSHVFHMLSYRHGSVDAPKHYMIRQVYASSSSILGNMRTYCSDKQRKKNPRRSQWGISPHLCVCVCVCMQAHVNVLLSLIIMFIHHNKPMNNSTLQNKGTTLCMLKNKRPYKWWTIGRRTKMATTQWAPLIHFLMWHRLYVHACGSIVCGKTTGKSP